MDKGRCEIMGDVPGRVGSASTAVGAAWRCGQEAGCSEARSA